MLPEYRDRERLRLTEQSETLSDGANKSYTARIVGEGWRLGSHGFCVTSISFSVFIKISYSPEYRSRITLCMTKKCECLSFVFAEDASHRFR